MVNAIKKGLIFGGILSALIGILQALVYFLCNDNLGCIGFNLILLEPGLIIGDIIHLTLTGVFLIILNLFLFFLVGFVLGFVVGLITDRNDSHTTSFESKPVAKETALKVEKKHDKVTIKR